MYAERTLVRISYHLQLYVFRTKFPGAPWSWEKTLVRQLYELCTLFKSVRIAYSKRLGLGGGGGGQRISKSFSFADKNDEENATPSDPMQHEKPLNISFSGIYSEHDPIKFFNRNGMQSGKCNGRKPFCSS